MRKWAIFATIAIALLGVATAYAGLPNKPASSAHSIAVLGVGNDTCLEWQIHHRKHDRRSAMQDQWLGGFLSGYNMLLPPADRGANFFENELPYISSAISHRCETEKSLRLSEAAFDFIRAMRKQTHPAA